MMGGTSPPHQIGAVHIGFRRAGDLNLADADHTKVVYYYVSAGPVPRSPATFVA
jgi:hypothetical protein